MSYNDGQVHTDFYEQIENLEQIATDFSEGDQLLKRCLLELWEKGIKTHACCKGHNETSRPPYLSIIIDERSLQLIKAMCEYLCLQEGILELHFNNNRSNFDIVTIFMGTEQDKIYFLDFLHSSINKNEQSEENSNHILLYVNYLLDFAKKSGLSCEYIVEKNQMELGYHYPGVLMTFRDIKLKMSELIDPFTKTGSLPLAPILCDEESLKQFINILYPGSFTNEKNIVK